MAKWMILTLLVALLLLLSSSRDVVGSSPAGTVQADSPTPPASCPSPPPCPPPSCPPVDCVCPPPASVDLSPLSTSLTSSLASLSSMLDSVSSTLTALSARVDSDSSQTKEALLGSAAKYTARYDDVEGRITAIQQQQTVILTLLNDTLRALSVPQSSSSMLSPLWGAFEAVRPFVSSPSTIIPYLQLFPSILKQQALIAYDAFELLLSRLNKRVQKYYPMYSTYVRDIAGRIQEDVPILYHDVKTFVETDGVFYVMWTHQYVGEQIQTLLNVPVQYTPYISIGILSILFLFLVLLSVKIIVFAVGTIRNAIMFVLCCGRRKKANRSAEKGKEKDRGKEKDKPKVNDHRKDEKKEKEQSAPKPTANAQSGSSKAKAN